MYRISVVGGAEGDLVAAFLAGALVGRLSVRNSPARTVPPAGTAGPGAAPAPMPAPGPAVPSVPPPADGAQPEAAPAPGVPAGPRTVPLRVTRSGSLPATTGTGPVPVVYAGEDWLPGPMPAVPVLRAQVYHLDGDGGDVQFGRVVTGRVEPVSPPPGGWPTQFTPAREDAM